jgi:type IV pilus assembly protein PilE
MTRHSPVRGQQAAAAGFSLIEVMIVLVIIGILLLVAVPGYQDSMKKSRRADGMRDLMELVSRQERFYAQNSRYTDDINTAAGLNFDSDLDAEDDTISSEEHYILSVEACDGGSLNTCYVLKATPRGGQETDPCGTLTVDSRGVRDHTGSPDNDGLQCW